MLLCVAFVFLVACTSSATPVSVTPSPTPQKSTLTPTLFVSPTPSPTATFTPLPTATATEEPEDNIRHITAIEFDAQGNLWVGGSDGVAKIDPITDDIAYYPIHNYATDAQVNTLLITEGKTIWVTTESLELFLLENEIWVKQEDVDAGKGSVYLYLIAEGEPGTVWANSVLGPMFYFDGEIWHSYVSDDSNDIPSMQSFARASDGTWWGVYACCMITYFHQFDGKTWTHNRPEPVLDDFVSQIRKAPDGSLWFKGGSNIYHYDTELVWTPYKVPDLGSHNSISTLTIASNGAVWIGTYGGDIQYFHNEVWYKVSTYQEREIRDIASSSDGTVWAATSDGCVIQFDQDGNTGKQYRVDHLHIFPDSQCSSNVIQGGNK